MIKLYHYTNKNFKTIKPDFFGYNSYTSNDVKASRLKRSFFYLDKKIPEYRFETCRYKYTAKISKNKIYNLKEDRKELIKKFKGNINNLLLAVKKEYNGASYNLGYNVIILFKKIKPYKIEEVTN